MMRYLFSSLVFLFSFIPVFGQNCGLIIPENPLNSIGLATPYILTSLDILNPCSVLDLGTSVFVEATILDIDTGNFFVYYPLVVDNLDQIAVPPVVPVLPKNNIIGIWFGANGMSVTLMNKNHIVKSLENANCVNGLDTSIFGQYAYCNAVNFYQQANKLIENGLVVIPQLGVSSKGDTCPTTRHFGVVDQDQSDNILSTYILTTDKTVAQNTLLNRQNLNILLIVGNGSDNRLLDVFINSAIFCKSFTAPNIIDPTAMSSSLALNELSANINQVNSVAFIPSGDPMALVNDAPNLQKLNLYRQGVNQEVLTVIDPNDNLIYCNNLANIAGPFFALHNIEFTIASTPDITVGKNLFNFLANRFVATWRNLKCQDITGNPSPITVTLNEGGVAIDNNILQKYGNFDVLPQNQNINALTIFFILIGILGFILLLIVIFSIYISFGLYIQKNKKTIINPV